MLKDVLRKRGFKGKLLAHVMAWFTKTPGTNYHPMSAYDSNNPLTIGRQLSVMQDHEIDGVIMTYQGPLAPLQHQTTVEFSKQCSERGMLFALLLDPWIAKMGVGLPEQRLTSALAHPDVLAMLSAPSYLPEAALLDFNTGVNWPKVIVPPLVGRPRPIWAENTEYSWPQVIQKDPISVLKSQNANPRMLIPGLCMSFFDGGMPRNAPNLPIDPVCGKPVDFNQQDWGTEKAPAGVSRYQPDRAGNYFFDQLDVTPMTAPYIALVTWNDFSERTAWEPWCSAFSGIRIQ